MGAAKTLLTAEQFDNYPFEEDKRYTRRGELIETEKPAYWHNHASGTLLFALNRHLKSSSLGEVFVSENVYGLAPSTRRSPDAAVILGDRQEELKDAKVIPIIPDIAAEILSSSETPRVIHRKLKQYFEAGVKKVWLIDPDSREVEVWRGATLPDHALGTGEILTSLLLPGFSLPLAELFA